MTVEQVNLLFKTLPIDLTYVDENDKVIFITEVKKEFSQEVLGLLEEKFAFVTLQKVLIQF